MKKIKICIIALCAIVLLIVIDIGSIYLLNKPLFAVKKDCDCLDKVYHGLLYNTYVCWEQESPKIIAKWSEYSCKRNIIVGKITDISNNYITINGLSDNNYLKANQEAQVILTDTTSIKGANNLIVGQYVKIIPHSIKEVYPIIIETNEIEIIYEKDIDF